MRIVYARQPFPDAVKKSIFLAGPTPRSAATPSWRPEALCLLDAAGFDGTVFVPETSAGEWTAHYDDQIAWEDEGLNRADVIVFWVPRNLVTMPAFTTNHEHGEWFRSGKCIFGAPPEAPKNQYLRTKAEAAGMPIRETLADTLSVACARLGAGAERRGGECQVPLLVWNEPSFQEWYGAQRAAGNRLEGARVEWTHRLNPKALRPFFWAVLADMHVAAEHRRKTNEVVIARPDISAVILYRRAADWRDVEVVLVREFRSPGATADGCVHELPGGSSFRPGESPLETAVEEVRQETGLSLDPSRLTFHGVRQMAATTLSYKARLFSATLTRAERDGLIADAGTVHGIAQDSERTYVEMRTVRELLAEPSVDWGNIGMILSVVDR